MGGAIERCCGVPMEPQINQDAYRCVTCGAVRTGREIYLRSRARTWLPSVHPLVQLDEHLRRGGA
jgi:hypothetical protein